MKIDNFEVRPCPFCGSERLMLANGSNSAWVSCRNCLTMGPSCESAEEAVKTWNSVYPALDTDFADVFLKALAYERKKKLYNSDDIEWIREKIKAMKAMKVNVNYILDQMELILGGPGNEDQ